MHSSSLSCSSLNVKYLWRFCKYILLLVALLWSNFLSLGFTPTASAARLPLVSGPVLQAPFSAPLMTTNLSQAATRVYGQGGSFTSGTANNGGLSQTSLYSPKAVSINTNGELYVADTSNNRVLHYPAGSTTADRVYGQGGSFISNTANNGGLSQTSLSTPTGVAADGSAGLYIADTSNNRVLHYSGTSTTADRVYGQNNSFNASNSGTTSTTLWFPRKVIVDGSAGIYVVDNGNNRVLHYSGTSTTADRVYGQNGSFTSHNCYTTQTDLCYPSGVALDGSGGLYIADGGNNRVLHYSGTSTTADRVYGQPSYGNKTINYGGLSATSLNNPSGISVDGSGGLYISDQDNHRVLHYSGTSTTADQVYGQPNFTSNSPNNGGVSATSLNTPFDLEVDSSGNLYVADYGNNRVLYYYEPLPPVASAGSGQSTAVNTAFPTKLVATVLDGNNSPVSSVVVTFTAPASGASGTFTGGSTVYTGTTNSSGMVTATTFTANTLVGSYTITATIGGVATPASFSLTNTVGTANSLSVISGNNQSATISTAFSTPLVAKVTDSYTNPISGTTVTFTAPASGASGTFAGGSATYVGTTNASGTVTSTAFSANGVAGSYSVSATVSGVASPAVFSLTNQAGVAATITALSGGGQNTGVTTAFAQQLVVQVKDSGNNPVSGTSVTFTAPASGASGTFTGGSTVYTGTTNSSGMVTATTFTANTLVGSYTVTATLNGIVTPASFALSNAYLKATRVYGQGGSFTSGTANNGGLSQTSLNLPTGIFIDSNSGLYVADHSNNRVLHYPAGSVTPDRVYGQSNFYSNNSGIGPTNLSGPSGVSTDGSGGLYIADENNHRVLHYSGISTTADRVYGQPDFYSNTYNNGGVSATSLFSPTGVNTDGSGGLYIVDSHNTRVLHYSGTSTTADRVYGQPDFYSKTYNNGGVSASSLYGPSGVAPDGSAGVYIADQYNNRVLHYSGTSTTADRVYGQSNFTFNSANNNGSLNATATGLNGPSGVVADGSAGVYIADQYNNRVLHYSGTSTTPDRVYGQPNYTSNSANNGGRSATSLNNLYGLTLDISGNLYVSDYNNHRVLYYGPLPPVASAGSGQSTLVNTAFPTKLVATVLDGNNSPVSSVVVTFTAPANGASGTFVGGSTSYVGTTDASGMVTATTFTANTLVGSYTVTATIGGVATPASFSLTNTSNNLAIVSGNNQNTWVSTAFNAPLVAKVTDSSNNPISGISVTFTAPASGASASFAGGNATYTGITNASGIVTTTGLTANDTAGSYTVNIVAGAATPVSYTLTNIGTVQVIVVSGDGQSTPINTAFPQPLVARVLDSNNQPVSGISVAFEAPGGGGYGSFAGGSQVYTATTDATGTVTSTLLTAGLIGGQWAVTADLGPSRGVANFSLTNTTQPAARIVVVSGSGQSTAINTNFAQPLVAKVLDASNQPVSGAAVSFTAPASGASGFFSTGPITMTSFNGTTDASGLITTGTFVANSTGGSYQVTATVSGVATPASFGLSNIAGPASSVSVVSGNNQSANTNTAFSAPLVVKVTDSYANPVSGVSVTFTAPVSGASGTFAGGSATYVGTTDATGTVTASTFSANGVVGSYSVSASVSGVASPAAFSLTNQTGVAATITVLSGGGQNASSNTTFAQPLVAQVKDSGNNPVSGVVVTFTAPSSGASGTFAGGSKVYTGTTDSKGRITTATLTANAINGSYSVSASVSGVGTPANFALTNQFTGNNRVYGQPDFTSNTSNNGGVTPISLSYPGGLVVDANGGLYISDRNNNRVLHYPANSTFADRVYGQPDLYSNIANNGGINETTLNSPDGVTIDGNSGGVYIADTANNRVLHYPAGSTTADRVYGQGGSFNTNGANNGGLSAASLYNPEGVAVDSSGGLYVADNGNNRILHYPSGSTTADRVYGQLGSFTSDKYYSSASPDRLYNPVGIAVDSSGGLYVADKYESRVVHYSGTSTTADKVYGQSDLYSSVPNKGGRSASSLYFPTGVMPDGSGGLYIADQYNNRVLHYSGTSTVADKVYGQSDFTSGGPNNGGVSASSLSVPWGVAVDGSGHLYVSDQNNNRVLYYGPNPVIATSGSGQSTTVNTAFPTKLVATVLDGNNSPVSSVVVTFTAPGSGASGTFAGGNASYVGTTDASGMVTTTTFTANSVSGSYSVSATLGGVGSPAAFSLINVASCNPLVVTSNLDDGSCGTLRAALSTASTGASKQVTITLSAGSVITLTSGLNLATGVSITTTATCTASGPTITIKGTGNSSGNGLTLSSGNSIYGLWVRGFSGKQIVAPSAGGNTLRCVKSTKS